MFDNFRAISYGFTGKLKGNPTLRKYFWVMISAIGFTFIILAYNSFMSLNFYERSFERFAGMDGVLIPLIVTISSAIIVYFLLNSFTGTMLDYIAGRSQKTEGHLPIFVGTIFALIGLMGLDIYANLQGVDYVAEKTTIQVVEDNSLDIRADLQKEINEADKTLKDLLGGNLGGYGWEDKKGVYHLNNSGKKYQRSLSSEKDNIRSQQDLLMSNSIQDREADKARFSKEVGIKQGVHNKLVYFAYAIAFLLCVIVNHYSDRAIDHVDGSGENPTDKDSGLQEIKSALSQLINNAGTPAVSAKKESDNQIGFKTLEPKTLKPVGQDEIEALKKQMEDLKSGKDLAPLLNKILGRLELGENGKANGDIPPINHRFTSQKQPSQKGPKRNGKRVEGMESRNAIKAAYNALKKANKKPTQAAISESTGISRKTVGNHIREMKREGLIK